MPIKGLLIDVYGCTDAIEALVDKGHWPCNLGDKDRCPMNRHIVEAPGIELSLSRDRERTLTASNLLHVLLIEKFD